MTSKSSKRRDVLDVIKDVKKEQRRINGVNRQNYSGLASADFGSVSLSASSGGSQPTTTNSLTGLLKTAGDTMMGPIAFSTVTKTLAAGVIDISKVTGSGYSSYVIASAAAGTHDLATITGAEFNGQLLFLDAPATVTIKLKHNTGNISIPDAADYDLVPNSTGILIYDYTITKWSLVSAFVRPSVGGDNLGNHTATQALNLNNQYLENTSHITPFDIGLSEIGNSTNYYGIVNTKTLTISGNSVNSIDTAKSGIFRTSTQGLTIKSDTIGASFGRTVFTDKDGSIRVDFDYAVGSKYFKFNYATGGFAIRHNATDADALLIYPVGNPFSSNNVLINANAGFTSGNGILIQRDSTDKIKIDADVNLLTNTNISGDLTMNSNDIFSVRTITPSLTNSAYTIGLDSTNNRWYGAYLNNIYTQGIVLRDTALTAGQTGLIEFINTVGITATSTVANARFRLIGMDAAVQIGNGVFVDTNDSTGGRSHTTGMFQESAAGVSPKILSLISWDEILFRGYGETTSAPSRAIMKGYSASSDITTTLLPASFFTVGKNTTTGVVRLWYNDAGSLKSVILS